MVARLLESHYYQNKPHATTDMIPFWLSEIHDVELPQRIISDFPKMADAVSGSRDAIGKLLDDDRDRAGRLLREEIDEVKRADHEYWSPLKQELSELRKRRYG